MVALGAAGMVSPVFVGRDAELATARAALRRIAGDQTTLLLVAGEAGVGKTRFVAEVSRIAREDGIRVLAGRCVQLGTGGLPFAPVAEALRELVRGIGVEQLDEVLGPARGLVARMVPAAGEVERAQLSSAQVMELVLGLIERLSEREPVLLVLEDLHWADRSTLDLVAFLAQGLRGVSAGLVVSYRSDGVDRRHPLRVLLTDWERNREVIRLELGRFGRAGVRAQLAGILGTAPDPGIVRVVYERSEGNPFLVEEMLAVVRAGDPQRLPPSLRDLLLTRADGLSAQALGVLRVAAVAGRSVPERLLVKASAMPEQSVLAALREAVDAQLLMVGERGLEYSFRHALVRDAVYDDLLPGERARLHGAYADAVEGDPGLLADTDMTVAASLAYHFAEAHDLPRALAAAVAAGDQAAQGFAPREAQAHYEHAIAMWPRTDPVHRPETVDLAELLVRASDSAYRSGEVEHAGVLLDRVLLELPAAAAAERRALVLHRQARVARELGRSVAAARLLQQALDLLPQDVPTAIGAQVLAALANSQIRRSATVGAALRTAGLAVQAARRAEEPAIEADAMITLGIAQAHSGDLPAGVETTRAALELATACGDGFGAVRAYINLSDLLETLGRSGQVAEVTGPGIALARRVGLFHSLGVYLTVNVAESVLHLGEWERAALLVDESLEDRPEGIFRASVLLIRAELAQLSGDVDVASAALAQAKTALADPDEDQFAHPLATIQADIARAAGDFARAADLVRMALPDEPEWDHQSLRYVWPLVWTGVRAEVERIRQGIGPARIDQLLRRVAETLPAHTDPTAAYRALALAEIGRLDGRSDWAEVCDRWRQLGWPWQLAYGLFRSAETEVLAGRRSAAGEQLGEAWEIASGLGAKPLAGEIERLAQRARVDLASRAEPVSGDPLAAYGLTAREREVLLLLASGRTNPEIAKELFISPKTASVHVSNLLAKLGMSSRVQVAGLASRLGLVG